MSEEEDGGIVLGPHSAILFDVFTLGELVTSLVTGFADRHGIEMTDDEYRDVGRDLQAILTFQSDRADLVRSVANDLDDLPEAPDSAHPAAPKAAPPRTPQTGGFRFQGPS